MSSVCISDCVNDPRVPVRARYINYKWPESDVEFFKTVKMDKSDQGRRYPHHSQATAVVVDSVSCRQMYLRSYTFSREESMPEKTKKCLRKFREKVGVSDRTSNKLTKGSGRGKRDVPRGFHVPPSATFSGNF